VLLLALAVIAAGCSGKSASSKPPAGAASGAAAASDKPYGDWKKLLKDSQAQSGFFTLHRKRENLYLELRPDQLGTPVLGIFTLSRGIGSNFVLGGLPVNDRVIEFRRAGDRVLMIERNYRFAAPAGSPIEKAKDLSFGESVLASLKIESVHDSSHAILVDLAPVLLSDLTDMAEGLKQSFNNKPMRFDKERSTIESVKTFPDNVEIEALLTFSPGDRANYGTETLPDDRFIPIGMHYSFSKLPDVAMQPRWGDSRVGFFLTAVKDFSRDDQETFWVRMVNRWRLEKKDPAAALSEPVKPIVFYVDRTVPEKYRPWVREGIEAWNPAFEAAGFKNAVVAKDAPDDSTWDAEDVRYSTVRWITSSVPSFSAIGPSRIDPRSGEILDADVLIEGSFMQNYRNTWRRSIGPSDLEEAVMPSLALARAAGRTPLERMCAVGSGLNDQMGLLQTTLLMDNAIEAGGGIPEQYLRQVVVITVLHEVGHTLGLRHNFRSSTATPYDKLTDPTFTRQHGITASVMDYEGINVAFDRSKQGDYFGTSVGDYDRWAIRYGYTPSGASDPAADAAFVKKIADESTQPGHEYSTDEDTYGPDALDPRTVIWDLGDDPLRYAKEHTAYLSSLWTNPKFEDKVLGAEGAYPTLRRAMDNLLAQYARSLGMAVKYVGGQYLSRDLAGQVGGRPPLAPVPAARQREALDLLAQRGFAADAFAIEPVLLNRLVQDRWAHWGAPNPFGPVRLDYDLQTKVITIQKTLLDGLLSPNLLARMREAEATSKSPYRLSEYFDTMTGMLWTEVGGTAAQLKSLERPGTRRELQRAYVDRLAALVAAPIPGGPDDARALARLQLQKIDTRCSAALNNASLGDNTRAHLLESRARIRRALDATRSADVRSAGMTRE